MKAWGVFSQRGPTQEKKKVGTTDRKAVRLFQKKDRQCMPRPPRKHQCDFVCIFCRVRDCYDVLGHPDHLHICWTCYLEFDQLPRAAATSSAFEDLSCAFEDLSGYATNIRSPDQQRHLARLVGTPSGNKPPKVSCKTLGLGNENASSASTSYARSEK